MHFIRAAEIVRALADHPDYSLADQQLMTDRAAYVAQAFITLAREFNPRFNTARFLTACGLESV